MSRGLVGWLLVPTFYPLIPCCYCSDMGTIWANIYIIKLYNEIYCVYIYCMSYTGFLGKNMKSKGKGFLYFKTWFCD